MRSEWIFFLIDGPSCLLSTLADGTNITSSSCAGVLPSTHAPSSQRSPPCGSFTQISQARHVHEPFTELHLCCRGVTHTRTKWFMWALCLRALTCSTR